MESIFNQIDIHKFTYEMEVTKRILFNCAYIWNERWRSTFDIMFQPLVIWIHIVRGWTWSCIITCYRFITLTNKIWFMYFQFHSCNNASNSFLLHYNEFLWLKIMLEIINRIEYYLSWYWMIIRNFSWIKMG